MNKPDIFKLLEQATVSWSKQIPVSIMPLPASGSARQYFRIKLKEKTVIGAWSDNRAENEAFIHFTKHFRKLGLNVPELFYTDLENNVYMVEDLGDETLYQYVTKDSDNSKNTADVRQFFQLALRHLIRFQIDGPKDLDFSYCIPRPVFDKQSILWDLQYFKYYVLKLFNINFDEQILEEDLVMMSRLLGSVDNKYFMYRDFQTRNILINKNDLYFVDYQGGRKGPLYYDLASLLFEGSINLTPDFREELIDYYISELSGRIKIKRQIFLRYFYLFVFLRILQVLAAYGLRGYAQNKSIFLKSYPFAVNILKWLLDKDMIKLNANELLKAAEGIIRIDEIREPYIETGYLDIFINSFSYKYGIPKDYSGHGGGFVLDCRILPNPGRYPEFREMTGNDKPVIRFLEQHKEVNDFLQNVRNIIDIAIQDYLERGMNRLMVSFGCTGGQHRSVYCASKIAEYIVKKQNIRATVVHGFYKNIGK